MRHAIALAAHSNRAARPQSVALSAAICIRGLNKARAEAALSVLAYNIIRAINLVGAATLRASLA